MLRSMRFSAKSCACSDNPSDASHSATVDTCHPRAVAPHDYDTVAVGLHNGEKGAEAPFVVLKKPVGAGLLVVAPTDRCPERSTSGATRLKPETQDDVGVTRGHVRQFGGAVEATLLVETRRLEVVGHCPYELAAANDCFSNSCLKQLLPKAQAAVGFVHPQLFYFDHARPTVTGD